MKIIECYQKLVDAFGIRVNDNLFRVASRQPNLGVQYCYPNGVIVPPPIADPKSFMFDGDFAGPFYHLEMAGVNISHPGKRFGKWKYVFLIAETDKTTLSSSSIIIQAPAQDIRHFFETHSNSWYGSVVTDIGTDTNPVPHWDLTRCGSYEEMIGMEKMKWENIHHILRGSIVN